MMRPSKKGNSGIFFPSQKLGMNIGNLPGRRSWCLYFNDENTSAIEVLAYFRGEDEARRAISFFEYAANMLKATERVP